MERLHHDIGTKKGRSLFQDTDNRQSKIIDHFPQHEWNLFAAKLPDPDLTAQRNKAVSHQSKNVDIGFRDIFNLVSSYHRIYRDQIPVAEPSSSTFRREAIISHRPSRNRGDATLEWELFIIQPFSAALLSECFLLFVLLPFLLPLTWMKLT